jgi:hypothetical protein
LKLLSRACCGAAGAAAVEAPGAARAAAPQQAPLTAGKPIWPLTDGGRSERAARRVPDLCCLHAPHPTVPAALQWPARVVGLSGLGRVGRGRAVHGVGGGVWRGTLLRGLGACADGPGGHARAALIPVDPLGPLDPLDAGAHAAHAPRPRIGRVRAGHRGVHARVRRCTHAWLGVRRERARRPRLMRPHLARRPRLMYTK